MIVWEFARDGEWLMAIYTLFLLVGYMRPSEGLSVRRLDLQAPVNKATGVWHVLPFPEERSARSKTYAANDSVELHSFWMPWFSEVVKTMSEGASQELLFPFSYGNYLAVWRRVFRRLPLEAVPYQARHSGASIDAAMGYRSRPERKSQGRWKTDASVQRYEKKALLTKTFNALSTEWKVHAQQCEKRLEHLLLRGGSPDELQSPQIRG